MKALFGSGGGARTVTDPGVAASNQYFMNMAQQPQMLDPAQKSYYGQLFGMGKQRAQQGAVGRFADLGFDTTRSGQLGGSLSGIESEYELGQATAEQQAMENRRGQIYAKMGAPQQQTVATAGRQGILPGLLGGFGSIFGKCWLALAMFGPTPEWIEVAYKVNFGTSWRARLARVVYWAMQPIFKGLLRESRGE